MDYEPFPFDRDYLNSTVPLSVDDDDVDVHLSSVKLAVEQDGDEEGQQVVDVAIRENRLNGEDESSAIVEGEE